MQSSVPAPCPFLLCGFSVPQVGSTPKLGSLREGLCLLCARLRLGASLQLGSLLSAQLGLPASLPGLLQVPTGRGAVALSRRWTHAVKTRRSVRAADCRWLSGDDGAAPAARNLQRLGLPPVRDMREPGYTVRLLLRGETGTDDSFRYWGDRLPYAGQFIEVTSEYHPGTFEARVTRVTPDDEREIHATEVAA